MRDSMVCFLVQALQPQKLFIKCSLNDHFCFRSPVPVVFFYRKTIPQELIIHSLKNVLNDFPLFAGVLTKESGQLFIDCNNQGVQVRIVHSDLPISHVITHFSEVDPNSLVDQFNPYKCLKNRDPVLTIKLTYHTDGMTIGCCWHHSVGDMSTFMAFFKALSAFAKGQSYQKALIPEDREDYLKDWLIQNPVPKSRYPCNLKKLTFFDAMGFLKQICSLKKGVYLYFTHDEIEHLRNSLSQRVGRKLTRNDALCAHLFHLTAKCRRDPEPIQNASIVVNYRTRIGMPSNSLGNYVGVTSLATPKTHTAAAIADAINQSIKNFLHESFHQEETEEFVQKNGGLKNISRILPKALLPHYKNFIISNWANHDVYSIDFGIASPYLFLPVGRVPMPWVGCIVEGFENKGLIVSMFLPSAVAKRFIEPAMLQEVHQYRTEKPDNVLAKNLL